MLGAVGLPLFPVSNLLSTATFTLLMPSRILHEIKSDEEKLLVASALMAVTRNLYIETIGAEDAAHVFASVADSFLFIEEIVDQHKPTIH